jgi:2'-5' RNA ligase
LNPHVSLASFEKFDFDRLFLVLKKIASRFSPVPFDFSSVASFSGKEGVLYLAPMVTPPLLQIHSQLQRALRGIVQDSNSYYLPGQWVPHCTIAFHLSPKKLVKGFQTIKKAKFNFSGRYQRLALVKTHPVHIRPVQLVYSVPLSGKRR